MEWLLIIAIVLFAVFVLWKTKTPKIGAFAMITGAPKTGKTTLAVQMAKRELLKRRLVIWIRNHTLSMIAPKKFPKLERPLLYSNIPLTIEHVPLTRKLLMRDMRFVYKSVVLLSEASLVADMMLFRDSELNERLDLFCKLIGHETRGGCLIAETHSIADCHYAFKRVTSQYFYIHSAFKFIPFFVGVRVLECRYSEDGSVVNTQTEDVEENLKFILIPKKVWKQFDAYCYSIFTDGKPCANQTIKAKNLKKEKIVSFRRFKTIKADDEEDN